MNGHTHLVSVVHGLRSTNKGGFVKHDYLEKKKGPLKLDYQFNSAEFDTVLGNLYSRG